MDKTLVTSIVAALAITAAISFVVFLTLPLAEPLVWALVIGISTHPHFERLSRRVPGHSGRCAGLMVTAVTICLILPMAGLVLAIAENAPQLYHQSQQLITDVSKSGTSALSRIPLANKLLETADNMGLDISGHAAAAATAASKFLLNAASGAVKNAANFVLTLAMAIFLLYFVYRDGEGIVESGVRRFAGDPDKVRHYLSEIRGTTTAVVVGTVLTCLTQGALAGVGYFFAGLPAPILCGALTAIAALVPVVGTAVIWVPLAGYLALTGAYVKAGLLAGWCVIFVGIADNAIRPLTIGATRDIPTLAIVFGAVGGVAVLGLIGLIVGPIIFACLVILWRDVTAEKSADAASPASEE